MWNCDKADGKSCSDYFDAHCHLAPSASGTGTEGLGLSGRLLCAVTPDDWPRLHDAAAAWPGTTPAYGLHPWYAAQTQSKWPDWLDRLEHFLAAAPTAWLGETGLDNMKTASAPENSQTDRLAGQLRLAARLNRHANLHCIKAWDALRENLDRHYLAGGKRNFIIHSFNGPHHCIKPLADRGAWFTIGPFVRNNKSERSKQRVLALPPDRLLVESDAFLPPGTDAAESITATAGWLAELRGATTEAMAAGLRDNFRRLIAND